MSNNEYEKRIKQLNKINKIIDKYANVDSLREYIKREYINEEGNAVINIKLYDDLDIYDKLSYENQAELNSEIYRYIDQKVKIIPAHIPLKLVFHGKRIEKDEQEIIKNLIYEHYAIELFDQQKNLRIVKKKTKRMLFIGITIFLICFYFSGLGKYKFITDFLSIVGTFSLWQVASLVLLERRDIDTRTMHIAKMLIHEIEFK